MTTCSHCRIVQSTFSRMRNAGVAPSIVDANGNVRSFSHMQNISSGYSILSAMGFSEVCECNKEDGEKTNEQFKLVDGNGKILPDTYYTLRLESGEVVHGTTDDQGRTMRQFTNGRKSLTVYLGHRE